MKPEPVAGAEAIPVVEGYTTARDRLFSAYEDNLDQIREWISARRDEFASLAEIIPQPLPAYVDVGCPDFRYERFSYAHDDVPPAVHAPEVERERRRYAEDRDKPDGVIAQRLAGDR